MSYQNHPNTTRRLLTAFMEFFSYIELERYGTNSTSRKIQKVPIQYCATDKWFQIYNSSSARKNMNLDANIAPVEMQWILPRLSVNLANIVYDSDRHLNKGLRIVDNSNIGDSLTNTRAGVPYNLEIELSSISKNLDDAFQIMEQIIPFFSPTLSIDIKITDSITDSIPIALNTVSFDFPQEISEAEEKLFIVTYMFSMRAVYYFQSTTTKVITTNFSSSTNPFSSNNLPLNIDGSHTLFAQFMNNSYNPNPLDEHKTFKDTDQVTLKDKGDWSSTGVYNNFDYVKYGTNKFIWIGGGLANIEPGKKGWESCWTLLSVIMNSQFNVYIDNSIKETFFL